MRVLILGIDGYLGWTLAVHLASKGYEVAGCDNLSRRKLVHNVGSCSATPIKNFGDRYSILNNISVMFSGVGINLFRNADITSYSVLSNLLEGFKPESIIHFAEMPSAPYSMKGPEESVFTHVNNLSGTLNLIYAMREHCPTAHLVKLGTMGEYGTPNIDITEGEVEIELNGRKALMPYPKRPGSFYHCTKVHDSVNLEMASRFWDMKVTDIMQGVVFGVRVSCMGTDDNLLTRFDFDECFGTAINRFCAQAIVGHDITPYGTGGQNRGFLSIKDSIKCINLIIDNPPVDCNYRVINQFDSVYNLFTLALLVEKCAKDFGLNTIVKPVKNPRIEEEDHYYNPHHNKLVEMGYKSDVSVEEEVRSIIEDLMPYKNRIKNCFSAIGAKTRWEKSG